MNKYPEAELMLYMLYMLSDRYMRANKALCRKLLRSGLLKADAILTPEQLEPLTESSEHYQYLQSLLRRKDAVPQALELLKNRNISVISCLSPEYPAPIRRKMGERAPLLLFCSGNLALFQKRCISLVGSRSLSDAGRIFAAEAGRQIARQGYVYCSGGAKGADTAGFEQAIRNGEAVLFLPDSLEAAAHSERYREPIEAGRLLLVSEEGCDLHFTAARALSRNHLIHALGEKTLVAQTDVGKGGTWNGTVDNLKHHYSPVFVCADQKNPSGMRALVSRGAIPVSTAALQKLDTLKDPQISF